VNGAVELNAKYILLNAWRRHRSRWKKYSTIEKAYPRWNKAGQLSVVPNEALSSINGNSCGEQDRNLPKHRETNMRIPDLEAMDFDDLWRLHEELTRILAEKITVEKLELERRLALLNRDLGGEEIAGAPGESGTEPTPRRKYPKVLPKYRNPLPPGETWSGRGKQPKWLVKALASGHRLEEFRTNERDQQNDGNKAPSKNES